MPRPPLKARKVGVSTSGVSAPLLAPISLTNDRTTIDATPRAHEMLSDDSDGIIYTGHKSSSLKRKRLAPSITQCLVHGGLGEGDIARVNRMREVKESLRDGCYERESERNQIIAHAPRINKQITRSSGSLLGTQAASGRSQKGYNPGNTTKTAATQHTRARRLSSGVSMASGTNDLQRASSKRPLATCRISPSTISELPGPFPPGQSEGLLQQPIPLSPPISPILKTSAKLRETFSPTFVVASRQPAASEAPISSSPPSIYCTEEPLETSDTLAVGRGRHARAVTNVSTASLQGMLPKRRVALSKDEYDIPVSSDSDEEQCPTDENGDELFTVQASKPKLRRLRHERVQLFGNVSRPRTNQAKRQPSGLVDTLGSESRLSEMQPNTRPKRGTAKQKPRRRITQTYGRQGSDKENDVGEQVRLADRTGDEEGDPALPTKSTRKSSRELRAISLKFESVDEWTMDFEETTTHSSSLDCR